MSFLKKLFKWLFKVLLAILVILAVAYGGYVLLGMGALTFTGFISAAVTAFTGLGWWAIPAFVGFGYLIDPDDTTEILTDVGESVAAIAGVAAAAAADIAGSTVTGLFDGLLSSPGGWLILGVGAYLLYKLVFDDEGSETDSSPIELVTE